MEWPYRGMMMSRQHTALLLWENANKAESSARFCTKKCNSLCFKTHHFPKSRIKYQWDFWMAEIWRASVHELNVTIVKLYFDPNKFREYFSWKDSKKKLYPEGKQTSSKCMTLDISLTSQLTFYYTVLGPFCRSHVFMRRNICMSFHSMHFSRFSFFCVYTEKDIRRNWTKPLL